MTRTLISTLKYRGLVFKAYDETGFLTIKEGNNIVVRSVWFHIPRNVGEENAFCNGNEEAFKRILLERQWEKIKQLVDAGRGLNIDYSKVIK